MTRAQIANSFKSIQDSICRQLEVCDGKAKFEEDLWQHKAGGGGRTRVIQDGHVFEKGGVNFSAVEGVLPPVIADQLKLKSAVYFATGVSIVIHPSSPFVPIIHMNIRYFELEDGTCWFGGGIDLTPIYVVDKEAMFFHRALKETCDKFQESYYADFKTKADDYFFIPHRNETRGVGGIFFDQLRPSDSISKQELWDFTCAVGNTFAPTYTEIVARNRDKAFNEEHTLWQEIRRGRYVEFNLVYDRGTKFGLETSGRIESILMSLPSRVGWHYNHLPKPQSQEAETLDKLAKGIDWVGM
ncbi:MAG: coproporphyrinogen III oxidase [Flavobacteriales bacterium]|jgi:coproporphyrinogen III oxidase